MVQRTRQTVCLLSFLLSSVSPHSLPSSLHRQMSASRNHSTGGFDTPLAITWHDDKPSLHDHIIILFTLSSLVIQYTLQCTRRHQKTAHWPLLDKMVQTISQGSVVTSPSGVAESLQMSLLQIYCRVSKRKYLEYCSALGKAMSRLVGWGLTALLTQNRSYRACRFVGIFYSKL